MLALLTKHNIEGNDMPNNEITVWGIHAGRFSEADSLFIKKNLVALGWEKMGDLSTIQPDREHFKGRVLEVYPDTSPGAVPNVAGQPFRFIHEMKVGDVVIYPSRNDRQIHIGIVQGEYKYDPSMDARFPHTRRVKWSKTLPRTSFTQGALYEIGSAMSLFQVRNYADEFIVALQGEMKPVEETSNEDETVAYVVAEIEQNTRDYILKRLAQQLKGHPFAHFVAHLLEKMGYRTRVSAEGPDGGIDIVAHKDELGFEPPIIKVQVKSIENGSVGDPEVSALYGKIGNDFGLFVTLGTFSKRAISFATGKSNLRLIDGNELVNLIFQHYSEFDAKYKGLLPLKRVYIPETIEETE
jgi:restriction system protein